MLPGLNELENDDQRFKRDLEMRADDVDVTGDAYRSVRIEELVEACCGAWAGRIYRR